jgi:hypothetical protein
MFEVHGWFELRGSGEDGELQESERQEIDRRLLANGGRVDGRGEAPGDAASGWEPEWANGLLVAFWSNGRRYVHLARLWNHRMPGEAALLELHSDLWSAARGTRGRIDVVDSDRPADGDWCEVWWFDNGQLERVPGDAQRLARWWFD